MSRNQMVDYMDVTGFLPRINRASAVCWRGSQLYIKGNPCYAGAPKYLSAEETREYMHVRFGYKKADMAAKGFDNSVSADIANMHKDKLTISETGRFIYNAGMPVKNAPSGIRETVVFETLPGGVQKVSKIGPVELEGEKPIAQEKGGDVKAKTGGMMLGVIAVMAAIGYLIFARKG